MRENPDFSHLSNAAHRSGYLISGFIKKTLSREEEDELDQWLLSSEENMELFERLTGDETVDEFLSWYANDDTTQQLVAVKRRIPFRNDGGRRKWWRLVAAASIILVVFAFYYLSRQSGYKSNGSPGVSHVDRPWQTPFASLQLPDGLNIVLSGDTVIDDRFILSKGILSCNQHLSAEESIYAVNVPVGGFQQIRLSDGTMVWLNAASSIHFPLSFSGKSRRVAVSGECFFEVAKDARRPFIAGVSSIEVKAIGTSFNIRAYPDEVRHRITMREGIVIIEDSIHRQRLQTGQEMSINRGEWITESVVDARVATAWIDNEFHFQDAPIEEVMQAIARWYGNKVVFRDSVSAHFNARISRNEPISKLLNVLSKTGEVQFGIMGDTIYVSR